MTKSDKADWMKEQDVADAGYDPKGYRGLQVHSQNTLDHEAAKFALCWVLDEMGRSWDTEVQCDNGRVDVFDYGPDNGRPVVYEIETAISPKRKSEKVKQYLHGPIREVFVIDPAEVPDNFHDAAEYFEENWVVGE